MIKLKIKIDNNYSYFENDLQDIPDEIIKACKLSYDQYKKTKYLTRKSKKEITKLYYITKNIGLKPTKIKYKEDKSYYYIYLRKGYFTDKQKLEYPLFDQKNKSFPTGWAFSYIIEELNKLDIAYSIYDTREKPKLNKIQSSDYYNTFEYRKYQHESIEKIFSKTRGIIRYATGLGKTLIAGMFILETGLKNVFIVPDLNLLYQTRKFFKQIIKNGDNLVGFIGDGIFNPKLITIATGQSLWSKRKSPEMKKFFQSIKLVFIDECHSVGKSKKNSNDITNTWFKTAMSLPNAYYRIGLSATPGESGNIQFELLRATTGGIIHEVSAKYGIKHGYLSKPIVYIYELPIQNVKGDWRKKYKKNIIKNTKRNYLIAKLANKYAKQNKKILISTRRKESHIEEITKFISEDYRIVTGDVKEKRQDYFDSFENGNINILIGTIIKQGLDITNAEVMIIAGSGRSEKETIQQAGRILRPDERKDEAIIIDFLDKDNSKLEEWSKDRIFAYEKAEYPIEYKYENINDMSLNIS